MYRSLRQVPLDVLLMYHQRLVACSAALPYSRALEWVQRRDEEERQMWADKHRSSSLSLGKIIKELYERRELMWDTSMAVPAAPPPQPHQASRPPKRQDVGRAERKPQPHKPPAAGKTADTMRDGKTVCRLWNQGKCSEPCPRGFMHVCNALVGSNGRVCGMRNHTSRDCRKTGSAPAAGAGAAAAEAPR